MMKCQKEKRNEKNMPNRIEIGQKIILLMSRRLRQPGIDATKLADKRRRRVGGEEGENTTWRQEIEADDEEKR